MVYSWALRASPGEVPLVHDTAGSRKRGVLAGGGGGSNRIQQRIRLLVRLGDYPVYSDSMDVEVSSSLWP